MDILGALISRLGIQPGDIQQSMVLMQRMQAAIDEVEAFKTGAQNVVIHFNTRMDRLETLLLSLHPTGANHDGNGKLAGGSDGTAERTGDAGGGPPTGGH